MEVVAVAGAWALNNLNPQRILQGLGLASLLVQQLPIQRDLTPRLSQNASVLVRGTPEYDQATYRWSVYDAPDFSAVVKVMTEADVQQTILYANQHEIPFFARSGGHGQHRAMAGVRNGIQIDMRGMDKMDISADGKSVAVGGGTLVKKFIQTLFDAKKEAVSGVCECVGFAGSLLGGGHGWLQGKYGLAIDQVLEARLVLSDGSIVTTSETSHPDLFWALKGAGQNFGIVTEFKYKIYDIPGDGNWHFEFFFFGLDKLEELYKLSNDMKTTQPDNAVHITLILDLPDIDPDHVTLFYIIMYYGPETEAKTYGDQVRALKPKLNPSDVVPYTFLAGITLQGMDDLGCKPGLSASRYPAQTNNYNVTALRSAIDLLDRVVHETPALNMSTLLLEQYSNHAVQSFTPESASMPHRMDELIMVLYVMHHPDPTLEVTAEKLGVQVRKLLLEGTDNPDKMHSYVNYAHGDELPEDMYGWEPWRLEKLRKVKKEYDPLNKFGYFAPFM